MITIPTGIDVADKKALWSCAEEELRRVISVDEVDRWFRNIHVLDCQQDSVLLGMESQDQKNYIEENYDEILGNIFSTLLQRSVEIDTRYVSPRYNRIEAGEALNGQHAYSSVPSQPIQPIQIEPLNVAYTFETFVVGGSNKMASAAAEAVADSPAKSYNPLFLYGGVGLGKTHLMQAIGNRVLKHHPGCQVVYLSAENFVNMFIDAIRRNERQSFQAVLRNVDVLLIDDIQFLAGKESTQEEFFHTFNTLHNRNKQIVISSDRPPKDIPTIEDRLRSRFEWGLIVDVGPPDFELRMAILRKKCDSMNAQVSDEVLEFIAKKVCTSIRELEGALQKIFAYARFNHETIDIDTVGRALGEIFDRPGKEISIEQIQRRVADFFNIKASDIIGKNRSRGIALPRQIAMYISRKLTRHSLPEIGAFFGNKDHTTVLFAFNKIEKEIEQDKELRYKVQQIMDSFS